MRISESRIRRIVREEVGQLLRERVEFSEDEVAELERLRIGKDFRGEDPIPSLERALRELGEVSTMPLYRGLTRPIEAAVGGIITLKRYASFSELPEVAEGFARYYRTGTVLELAPGARGFNYWGWLRDELLEKRRTLPPDEWQEMRGDYYLSTLDGPHGEREWILPMGSRFRVIGIREGDPSVYEVELVG